MVSSTSAGIGADYVNRIGVSAMGGRASKRAEVPLGEWFDLPSPRAYDERPTFFDSLEKRLYVS
jgi:hypothetical protein